MLINDRKSIKMLDLTEIMTKIVISMEGRITEQQAYNSSFWVSNYEDVHQFVINKLAEIRFVDANILEQEVIQNGGDLGMDSEEGAGIAYGLEGVVGRELIARNDLKPENFTSAKRLAELLYKNLQKTN